MDDLLIRGGQVIDGTGTLAREADVAISEGRIVEVGDCAGREARRVIDASGQVVAPGFIDIHTHSDFTLPLNPLAESKIRQGVTTEVVGNCGYSTAPVLPGKAQVLQDYLGAGAPWLDYEPRSFGDYMDGWPATSVNTVMQVGHATLRLMTMGMEARSPTASELSHMESLLAEGLEAGALGMSTGLFTAPGNYAQSEELLGPSRSAEAARRDLRLACPGRGQPCVRRGARGHQHWRDGGCAGADCPPEAVGNGQLGAMCRRCLSVITEARERGVQLFCDQYPYTAGTNPLRNLLPVWVHEGGVEAMLQRLRDGEARERMRGDILQNGLTNFGRVDSWHAVRIAISPETPELAGQTVGQVAESRGIDQLDAACDILLEDKGHTRIVVTSMDEGDVQQILQSPMILVGSDGNSLAPYGVTSQGKPHPRFYGTFARVLGHYARDLGLLPLHTAIHKMTGGSATALRLVDRGTLEEGNWADVTIFNPDTVAEVATYDDPHQYATGISTVLVNGEVVIDGGEHTGALSGRVLRRGANGVG